MRLAFVVSTGGSVMSTVLDDRFVRDRVHLVIADRLCDGLDRARDHGLAPVLFEEPEPTAFGDAVLDHCRERGIDYILSFYTDFFSAPLRADYRDRIVNFHPSVLPAFKGMDGFGDAVRYPARFTGNTVEFVREVMDEGVIIMQTVCPIDLTRPLAHTRHRVFTQQCRALMQVVRWLDGGRVSVDGDTVHVADARFDSPDFSPALDDPDVVAWSAPELSEAS